MLTAFGVSMVAGSALTPLLSRWISARGLLVGALGLAGCAFVLASSSSAVPPVVVAWGMSGLAGGIINVTYETLLQIDTPDAFRGRVFAAVESIQEAAYVIGAALVATFAIGVSPSTALLTVGVAFFGCSLIAMMLLPGEAMLAEAEPVG
jgi:predicted MFS family arabinose efflux permease